MHRIDEDDAAGLFKVTPAPATRVTPAWANAVQEEVAGVVEAAGIALSKPDNDQLLQAIRRLGARPGTITMYGGSVVPDGALECDGSEVLIADQPALAAAIGDTWGEPSDPAYFVLPDFRGRTLRGWDNGAGRDPGRVLGSYQDDAVGPLVLEMPWATSASSGNDLTPNGGIMTDAVTGSDITWAPTATNTEAETRMKNGAGMVIIQT